MRLTIGQLRQVIREEVFGMKGAVLRENSSPTPPIGDLMPIAQELAQADSVNDFMRSHGDMLNPLREYICGAGGVDETRKWEMVTLLSSKLSKVFRGKGIRGMDPTGMADEVVSAACLVAARGKPKPASSRVADKPQMTPEQMKDFEILAQEEGWTDEEKSAAASTYRQAGDQAGEIRGMKRSAFVINGPIYAYVWKGRRGQARWENMDDLYS